MQCFDNTTKQGTAGRATQLRSYGACVGIVAHAAIKVHNVVNEGGNLMSFLYLTQQSISRKIYVIPYEPSNALIIHRTLIQQNTESPTTLGKELGYSQNTTVKRSYLYRGTRLLVSYF